MVGVKMNINQFKCGIIHNLEISKEVCNQRTLKRIKKLNIPPSYSCYMKERNIFLIKKLGAMDFEVMTEKLK